MINKVSHFCISIIASWFMGCVELRCSLLKYIGELEYQNLKTKIKIFGIHIKYRLSTCVWEGCMRAASTWRPWVSGLVGHFVQTWPDSELLSHRAVLRLYRLELTLQSLSPVLALYDPFGVDVPLNCDSTTTSTCLSSVREKWSTCHILIHVTSNATEHALPIVIHAAIKAHYRWRFLVM